MLADFLMPWHRFRPIRARVIYMLFYNIIYHYSVLFNIIQYHSTSFSINSTSLIIQHHFPSLVYIGDGIISSYVRLPAFNKRQDEDFCLKLALKFPSTKPFHIGPIEWGVQKVWYLPNKR
jgi:hypothetical protein